MDAKPKQQHEQRMAKGRLIGEAAYSLDDEWYVCLLNRSKSEEDEKGQIVYG